MKKQAIIIASLISAVAYADDFYTGDGVALEETVVSTSGFQEELRSVPNNVEIITKEDIKEHNYQSVADILSSSSNIYIINNVFGGTVDMRGQGDRAKANTQVLVDGVNLNPIDRNHGVLPLDTINVDSIEKIEIIPGGGSILYGGGTAGGVINIITKKTLDETNHSLGYEAGSYGKSKFTASTGANITEDFSLQFNYNQESEDGYRDYSDFSSQYFDVITKYQISEKQDISLKLSKYSDDKTSPDDLTEEQLDEDRQGSSLTDDDASDVETLRDELSVNYNYDVNNRVKFTLNASNQNVENTLTSTGTYGSVSTFEDKKLSFSPKVNLIYGEKNNLIIGYDYIKNDGVRDSQYSSSMMSSLSTTYDMSKTSNSIFALNKYKINEWELTQGLRYEAADYSITRENYQGEETYDHSKDLSDTAIELAANYLYSDSGNVYARWENAFILPAPNEMINKVNGEYVINDIKSESFITLETGISDYIANSLVQATAYYTVTKDEINVEMSGMSMANLSWEYSNLEETIRQGIELKASQTFGKFDMKESVAYIDAKVTKGEYDGKQVPYVAKTNANLDVTYKVNPEFNTVVSFVYKDSYYLDADNESDEVNDHLVANFTANYIFKTNTKFYAGINNLFDEDYYNSISYSSSSDSYTYDPAAERNYFLGFKYHF